MLEGAHGCAKGANPFVERYLGDCLYGQVQLQQLLFCLQILADVLRAWCHGPVYGIFPSADLSLACRIRDWLGFSIGMASIMFWMVAQVPQFVKNIKQQRADALSAWFLAEWLLVRGICSFTVCVCVGAAICCR